MIKSYLKWSSVLTAVVFAGALSAQPPMPSGPLAQKIGAAATECQAAGKTAQQCAKEKAQAAASKVSAAADTACQASGKTAETCANEKAAAQAKVQEAAAAAGSKACAMNPAGQACLKFQESQGTTAQ